MNRITWTIFAILTVGLLGFLIISSNSSDDNNKDIAKDADISAVQTANDNNGNIADHTIGKTDSKIILIEYGDYQCSGCASENTRINEIVEEYKDQILFIFRNYPLPATSHPNARAAAAAVEAAGLQDKYWEMHNKVYDQQATWEYLTGTDRTDYFKGLASDLGLDTDKFVTDMGSDSVSAKITYDRALGEKANITETPSFYLNGKKIESTTWGTSSKMKAALDSAIKDANS